LQFNFEINVGGKTGGLQRMWFRL